jgi:hypothetical protein
MRYVDHFVVSPKGSECVGRVRKEGDGVGFGRRVSRLGHPGYNPLFSRRDVNTLAPSMS